MTTLIVGIICGLVGFCLGYLACAVMAAGEQDERMMFDADERQ